MNRIKMFILLVTLTALSSLGLGHVFATTNPPRKVVPAATPLPTKKPTELLPQPKSGFPPGIAPESARVDIVRPTFSNPGAITNPLLPYTKVDQIVQIGQKEGLPHRTELTLLPGSKTIQWLGEGTNVRALQFVAYLDGRILETAIDYVAQADGGAVWYFGEDVNNYTDGRVANTEGTWRAGKDIPPAMIMPAKPQVGNVYRVENTPGVVFEEVKVKAVNQTLEGPRGLVQGVMFVQQIGMDGMPVIKAFVPGYGEFLAHTEDAAVALPTDALKGPVPTELKTLLSDATSILNTSSPEKWEVISDTLNHMTDVWDAYHASAASNQFPLLNIQLDRAFSALVEEIKVRNPENARKAAFDVAVATLDLQMPYHPLIETELARFVLWTQRVRVDSVEASAGAANVAGDVAVLDLIWNRVGHTVDTPKAKSVVAQLGMLRTAADEQDPVAASIAAAALQKMFEK
jgi:hypothetical protein